MKIKFLFILSVGFFAGAGFWKWRHPAALVREFSLQELDLNQSKNSTVVNVGERRITVADLKWEQSYQDLLKLEEKATANLDSSEAEKLSFKKFALQNLIERDVLIQVVRKDMEFRAKSENILSQCKKDSEHRIVEQPEFFKSKLNREKVSQDLCELALISQYFKDRIEALIEVSLDEKKTYFKNHRNKFAKNQMVSFRQIVLATEGEAKKVRSQVKLENFSALAKKFSITPEANQGGSLAKVEKGTLPQVFDFLFSMPTGSISDIIKTSYGFHIVTVDKKNPSRIQNFTEVESQIEKAIKQQKSAEAYQSWVNNALNIIAVSSPSSVFALSAH